MTAPYVPNPDISLWQMAAVALCEDACGYSAGLSKTAPKYLEVVERRDLPAIYTRYSSCGDLGNWLLERLGLTEKWLNRATLGHYVTGANVARLGLGCPIAHAPPSDPNYKPGPGDICEVWNTGYDAHVFVCLGPGSDERHIRTANYGASGMSAASFPGANIADSQFLKRADGWHVGLSHPRKLQRVIKLADAIALAKVPPNLAGARLPGEVLDALQARMESTDA